MSAADYQSLVYSRDRLTFLQRGIKAALDAIQGVLSVQDELTPGGHAIKSTEHIASLEKVEKECWERIRVDVLDVYKRHKKRRSTSHTVEINGNDDVEKTTAEYLLDFTQRLDEVVKGLDTRLKVTAKREENMIKEVKLLQEQLYDERQKTVEMKWKMQEVTGETNSGKYSTAVLQQQLKEKQDHIAQLKRNGTVQLWDKEKQKLMEAARLREEQLTKELEESKKAYDDMKEKLLEKLRDVEEKLKIQKLKDSIEKRGNRNELEGEVEQLKRKIYSMEKDMSRLEDEIVNQQRLAVGCFKGIQKDFKIIVDRQEEGKFRKVDVKRMKKILSAIYEGSAEGRLEITKADLPLHYISLPEDITGHPIKKVTGKSLILRPTVRHHLTPVGSGPSPQPSPDPSPPGSPRVEGKKLEPIDESENDVKTDQKPTESLPAMIKAEAVRKRRESRISLSPADMPHPDLIDFSNGHLEIDVALRHYPELTETQIRDHFEQFRRYDTSGDLLLDFTEVVRAIQSTVGNYYSPAQVKEAMLEIDTDGNDTVDFFEYLAIATMVTGKGGKSEVFRSGVVKHGGQSVSKLCSIQ